MKSQLFTLVLIFSLTTFSCAQQIEKKETNVEESLNNSIKIEMLNKDSILAAGLIDLGNQWLELDSNDYNGWVSVASGYALQKNDSNAVNYFKKAYQINGKDSFYLVYNYALCLYNLKQYKDAIEILKNFKQLKKNNNILYLLILNLYEQKMYKEVMFYRKLVAQDYENLNPVRIITGLSLLKLQFPQNQICIEIANIKTVDLPNELKNLCSEKQ